MDPLRPGTISKEMENETAMSSVRRCAFIRIDTLEFIQHFESTNEIVVTMSMENRRSKKLISQRFSANNGEPSVIHINGEFQLFYSHNVKNHRDPILRFAVENTRAKTFTRHRSIAASLVSMQQVVQHDFDGILTLYESHVTEKNPIGRIRVHIRSVYMDDDESSESSEENEVMEDMDSSDGENQRGLSRISRSIKSIFSSSNGNILSQRQLSNDITNPERASSPLMLPRPDIEDVNSPIRRQFPRRPRNPASFFSDGGSGYSSRTHSIDMGSGHPLESQQSDCEVSSSMDSGNGENQLVFGNSFHMYLQDYKENMLDDNWQPFVLLLQQTSANRLFYDYLCSCTSQYGIAWKDYVVLVKEEDCIDCIQQLYSLYTEKMAERDLEPFRILFIGDDAFLWYLLIAYLLLVNNRPYETLNLLFLPLSLSCSLAQLIACQSVSYLQVVLSVYQCIHSLTQGQTKNMVIEQSLYNLLKTDYVMKLLTIHEISLQRSCMEKAPLFGKPEIVRFLSNDQGKASKLKIPYLFAVSIGTSLSFSPSQYADLLEQMKHSEIAQALPDLQSQVRYNVRDGDMGGILDYWLESDQKQVTFESKSGIRSISVQRNGEEGGLKLLLNVPLSVLNNKKKKAFVNKYSLADRGKSDEDVEGYECIINKMMFAMSNEDSICVDGIPIDNVNFMTISNRYFSKMKTFPFAGFN